MSEPAAISIRPYILEDIPRGFEAVLESKKDLAPWMPWCHAAYSIEDSRAWVESQIPAFQEGTEYSFVIVDAENRFLGGCGLNQFDRPNRRANLGYWVRSSQQRRGIAAAAVKLLVGWAFSHTDFHRLEVMPSVENVASLRVAEKAGAFREGLQKGRLCLYGRMHDAVMHAFLRL